MMPLVLWAFALLSLSHVTSTAQQPLMPATLPHLPLTMAALGDSYSAGLGSGRFLSHSKDGRDNTCARMDGSYPWLLSKLSPFHIGLGHLPNFVSCSGNRLEDVEGQIDELDGEKFDIITLSISGNDFMFSPVVVNCVYPYRLFPGTKRFERRCNGTLTEAQEALHDPGKWKNFTDVIHKIQTRALKPTGKMYVTGYAKFFARPMQGDACDSTYFFPRRIFAALPMTYSTRLRMNELTDFINARMQSEITNNFDSSVVFIDIDEHFAGRRFCEPANQEDPIGAANPNVWFNDLTTPLEENAAWNPETVDPSPADDPWAAWALELPESIKNDTGLVERGIGDNLQRASSFHPKKAAHIITAMKLANAILKDFVGHHLMEGTEMYLPPE